MLIEVLHIEECPNWRDAEQHVRAALDELGLAAEVRAILIETHEDAAATAFAGSPTIVVDGADLFPSDTVAVDLACRVYVTETGLAGLPSMTQLVDALRGLE